MSSDPSSDIHPMSELASSYTWEEDAYNYEAASASSSGGSFAEERFGLYIFVILGAVALALVALFATREFYLNKYNYDIFFLKSRGGGRIPEHDGSTHSYTRRQLGLGPSAPSHIESDRELAEELQRRLNEEEREAERMQKRADRREWYSTYLKPFTMTAQKNDFFYAHEMNHTAIEGDTAATQQPNEEKDGAGDAGETTEDRQTRFRTMSTGELTVEEYETDVELGIGGLGMDDSTKSSVSEEEDEPIVCTEDADDAHLYMHLPVFKHGHRRSVDADCAICVSQYEEGEKVVWSNLECKHAFHEECIMPWLAKGKKRCPICRHWFVPGTRIEDQKKALLEANRLEGQESSSAETDDTSGSDSSSSGSQIVTTPSTDSQDLSNTTQDENTNQIAVIVERMNDDNDDDNNTSTLPAGDHDSSTLESSSKYDSNKVECSDDLELGGRMEIEDTINGTTNMNREDSEVALDNISERQQHDGVFEDV